MKIINKLRYTIISYSISLLLPLFLFSKDNLTDKVNMMLGTWGYTGGLIPGVTSPFGMTSFTPMTRYNRVGNTLYQFEDTTYLLGFRGTHQPTVWMGDYGYHTIWTGYGTPKSLAKDRKMRYSHSKEKANPYQYSVDIWDPNNIKNLIKVNLTASSRAAYYRFKYLNSGTIYFNVEAINTSYPASYYRAKQTQLHDAGLEYGFNKDAIGYANYDSQKNEIIGYNTDIQSCIISPKLKNFKGYFVIKLNKKPSSFGMWKDSTLIPEKNEIKGNHCGAYLSFKVKENEIIEYQIGTSFISIEQARENLKNEIGSNTYEKFEAENKSKWEEALQRIEIATQNPETETLFYTFLYHSMQYPREMDEYGKFYSAAHDSILIGKNYTDFSLWDTFRAAHPLICLTNPERVSDMIQSLLTFYKGSGRLPIWPNPMETNIMIGSHADAVIADGFLKGFNNYDTLLAYQAIKKNGTIAPINDFKNVWADRDTWTSFEGRGGLTNYISAGYVASDITKEAPARTLEYALDDYCIAQMAKKMNFKNDYESFYKQSLNFKNTYDPDFGYFMARRKDGSFSNDTLEGFTEGSFWNYAFWAPHAPDSLIKLYGGVQVFSQKINKFYSLKGYGEHGNEQIHHYPYLYHYAGNSSKAQETVYNTLLTYKNAPWGIGNEDCGQMSAWFVFNALGFYPMSPCKNEYEIGMPLVDHALIKGNPVSSTKDLKIMVNRTSSNQIHIAKVLFNGEEVKGHILKHNIFKKGGVLEFFMKD